MAADLQNKTAARRALEADRKIFVKSGAKYRDWRPDKLLVAFQREWCKDRSRLKLWEKSRQIGATWTTSLSDVDQTSVKGAKYDVWVTSRDEIQARLYIDDALGWTKIYELAARGRGEEITDGKTGARNYYLPFANGRRINSMSSNIDAQAGKRGSRRFDEFALHKDQRGLWAIGYPGITWGGNLEAFSTHRGKHTFFNKLIEEVRHNDNPKAISLHRTTLEDALNDGLLVKLKSKWPADDERQAMDEQQYYDFIKAGAADAESAAQEYDCIPQDESSIYITWSLLEPCLYPLNARWQMTPEEAAKSGNTLYLGMDIGRRKDITAIRVYQDVAGIMLCIAAIDLYKTPFAEQEFELYRWLSLPNMRRACIDETGIGMQLGERAVVRFGAHKVEPISFTVKSKAMMAPMFKIRCEQRTIRIPNTKEEIADIRMIEKEVVGDHERYVTSSKEDHADRFWAHALACTARGMRAEGDFAFEPVRSGGDVNFDDYPEPDWEGAFIL